MRSIRNILAATLLLAVSSVVTCQQRPDGQQETTSDEASFQKLLDQVDPPALHAVLHSYSPKKFQHGMFDKDRAAVEAIHKDEPSLATNIVNLAKRQDPNISNGTAPASLPAQPNSPVQPGPTETPGPSPGPASSRPTPVPQESSEAPAPGSPSPSASASASVPPSPSPNPESTPATPSTGSEASTPAETLSSVPGSLSEEAVSSTPLSSAAATSSSLTDGDVITTTDAKGDLIVSTIGGGVYTITPSHSASQRGGSGTSVTVQTNTLPGEGQSTVTAITVVNGGTTEILTPSGTAGVAATGTGGQPGLQTGEAVMTRGFGWEGVGVLVGAVGFAVMM